jgi:hypothetical protein
MPMKAFAPSTAACFRETESIAQHPEKPAAQGSA